MFFLLDDKKFKQKIIIVSVEGIKNNWYIKLRIFGWPPHMSVGSNPVKLASHYTGLDEGWWIGLNVKTKVKE